MKQTKSNSYNSTPFSTKENVCPNSKFHTLHQPKKTLTPSIGTDPQFSIFNTINVPRMSQPNSLTTKSRAEMEAIIEDFSHRQSMEVKEGPLTHKSFLALLGLAMGKDEFSMEEAIEKCEQFEITDREQLLNIIESKEPTREWPLPLSNLLLTDLGQLKIMNLCNHLENEEDISQSEIEILQFLLPKDHCIDTIDKSLVLDHYHDFRNKIDEKFNIVDRLVKEYTLRIQPKIRNVQDKMLLIKTEKRLRKFQKVHRSHINYLQLKYCLEGLCLSQQETLVLFKYLYFIENDKVMDLVDRKQEVQLETCLKQIFQKGDIPFAIPTVSRIQLVGEENMQIINDLLADKTHLLQELQQKEQEIMKLNNAVTLLKLKLENQHQEAERQKKRQVESVKLKYSNRLKTIQMESEEKDNLIEWYRNQLDAAVQANHTQLISKQRHRIFRQIYTENLQQMDFSQS